MAINNSVTTDAVTANRVMLASVNALAMSAPNAGPPVTCTAKSAGKPVPAAVRSAATASFSARPDKSALIGTTPIAALPSADTSRRCARGGRTGLGNRSHPVAGLL